MAATINAVAQFPRRDEVWVIPCANAQRDLGVHSDIARVAVGNAAPSPMPSATRERNSDSNPPAAPVQTVANATAMDAAASVSLGPNLSPNIPPKSWNSAYG